MVGGGNVTSVSIPSGSTSAIFYLTPGGSTGSRNISITTLPALTYVGSPLSYIATTIPILAAEFAKRVQGVLDHDRATLRSQSWVFP